MKKIALLAAGFIALLAFCPALHAVTSLSTSYNADAPNIAAITKDTITLITGETHRFTVDSPVDQGPVPTAATVEQLNKQLSAWTSPSGDLPMECKLKVIRGGTPLADTDVPATGDTLQIIDYYGKIVQTRTIETTEAALAGNLKLYRGGRHLPYFTTNAAPTELILDFTAGQRTPNATVTIQIPAGITITLNNTHVNVIGRGEVPLSGLATQSIGRASSNYTYKKVGDVTITGDSKTGQTLTFTDLDLRHLNKPDLRLRITGVQFTNTQLGRPNPFGGRDYCFKAAYTTTEPKKLTSPADAPTSTAELTVYRTIADFTRVPLRQFTYTETPDTYTSATFTWTPVQGEAVIKMSVGSANEWKNLRTVNLADGSVQITGIPPGKICGFQLVVASGPAAGESNVAWYDSGKIDVKTYGVKGDGVTDDTDTINNLISFTSYGGGTLRFPPGTYNVRTIHLRSNVWLYLDAGATIRCIGNCDVPETTWFSEPTPDPENYMHRQDMARRYFQNAMFTAEREDNIKIIGPGRITGAGALATGDAVMDNPPARRADKMFSLKLCTHIEIGGLAAGGAAGNAGVPPGEGETAKKNLGAPRNAAAGATTTTTGTMLHIDQGGSIALLATGCDDVHVHDICFDKPAAGAGSNAGAAAAATRDPCSFMGCNNVTATNIYFYSRTSKRAADIIKTGASHALGFTRPAGECATRNIIAGAGVDSAGQTAGVENAGAK